MLTNLIPIPRNEQWPDYRAGSGIPTISIAIAILQSQNALYKWIRKPVLLAVGWLNINLS
ncbi:MAG: hypothetical protein F6K34_01290 [Okeania sp. SIO4D6]|uniref:hypothetical protein n=1 Tax=Okeania sp. SIO2G5 TaxID=2607796 RepID=UPI0013C1D023|nr:hypothetical protein [Okeania sp. SIO2G5]NEP03563.1 hypothetical protein [Okeania sp. SIO4D6]NEP74805.1 hypothetical protein [Okeania sp. SIO2G5]